MPKVEKVEAVRDLTERFKNSNAALLTEFVGLKVSEMKELRQTLTEAGGDFKVVKNTLSRIAAREAQLEELIPLLEGSTAIAFISGDPVSAAKGLDAVSKKYPALVIKGGILEGSILDAGRAAALAKVAPKEVLLGQLAGMLQSPVQKLAYLLSAPVRELGYALGALREKRQTEGADTQATPEAPAEASPIAEAGPEAEPASQPAAEAATDASSEAAAESPPAEEAPEEGAPGGGDSDEVGSSGGPEAPIQGS